MRFLGILSTVLTLIAIVVAVVLTTQRADLGFGEFLVIVWPVALGVAVLSVLILLFASGSAKLLSRIDAALRREPDGEDEGKKKGVPGPSGR